MRAIERRRYAVLAVAVVIVAISAALATRLTLKTDMSELLPSTDPAVLELNRIKERLGGISTLTIGIQGPDKAANLRYAEHLTKLLRAEPKTIVDRVTYHTREEHAFFEGHKWLYAKIGDLEEARDRLRSELRKRKNPLLVDLSDDTGSLDDLRARMKRQADEADRYPEGYFMSPDGKLVVLVVWPPGTLFAERAGEALYARVQALVKQHPPTSFHPQMKVGYQGQVYDTVEERKALENDIAWATGLCLFLVALSVVLFYGRLRAIPLMAAPALCGVTVAFGLAYLLFGYLNASTAFLGSIIVGNGINFAIIQLARYEEERRAGVVLGVALQRSVAATARATVIAALAASLAYGSLMVTNFRGFSQFGMIGGIGMIAAWLATVTVLPALLAVVDRRRGGKPLTQRGLWFGVPFARAASRAPVLLLGLGVVLSVAAVIAVPRFARDPFEYDFRNLRSAQSPDARELSNKVDAVFGRTLSPIVILADRFDQVGLIRDGIRRADAPPGPGVIGDITTVDDILPGSLGEQRQKLAVLGEIRKLLKDPSMNLLDEQERAKVKEWEPPADLAPVTVEELPNALVRPFRDSKGELAPIVLVYHKEEAASTWNGRDLLKIAGVVQTVKLSNGEVVRSTGGAVVFAGMIRAIVRDGPVATGASFLGVVLLVAFLARGLRGAAAVLAALLLGVLWMVGAAALLKVRVNFLNFIALPITFGIGIDYAINIWLRYRIEGPGRMVQTVRATGGAVALCSLTTVIGYAALLIADNQGLRSFGSMAIIGEFACLSAALLMMPAWFILWDRRRAAKRAKQGPAHPSGVYALGGGASGVRRTPTPLVASGGGSASERREEM
ncbi:MAG TPA: MMPL family transporter [Polyangia bacterium]